ncbi:hypothetical protein D7V93_09015 [Corallococcus llansteffanensis]|uniref:Uncharacterized protein n=2 Tax=Corallococcus llansteffanensis TaxID=2316731 RepID=A0A3A8QEJ5_9BACT|nr:hypothetical protein D7V93_09015 [Corallococcus llansteffanensis]
MMDDRVLLDDGTAFYGSPETVQQAYNELVYETTTHCIGYCYGMTDPADPDPLIVGDEGDHGQASTTTEPGGIQVNPSGTTPTAQPFVKSFHKDDSFGSGLFGSGYSLDASLKADPVAYTLEASGEGKVWAKLFNSIKFDVVRATAKATSKQNENKANLVAKLYVVGAELYSQEVPFQPIGSIPEYNKTFLSKSFDMKFFESPDIRYTIFFIPVKVKAGAYGKAGVTVNAALKPTAAKLSAIATGNIYGEATAAADVWVVSAGVKGTLTLVEASLPTSAQLALTTCGDLAWDLKSGFTLKTLSGKLEAFVKVKLFIFKKTVSLTIAKWSGSLQGSNSTWTLFNAGGGAAFASLCSAGSPVGGAASLSPPASPAVAAVNDTGTTTGGGGTGGGGGGGGGGYGGGGCFQGGGTAEDSQSIVMIPNCY